MSSVFGSRSAASSIHLFPRRLETSALTCLSTARLVRKAFQSGDARDGTRVIPITARCVLRHHVTCSRGLP